MRHFLLVALLLAVLQAQHVAAEENALRVLDEYLGKFAQRAGEGLGHFRWPSKFERIWFQTTRAQNRNEFVTIAFVKYAGSSEKEIQRCHVIAAQALGMAFQRGVPIGSAIVACRCAEGRVHFVEVPRKEATAMGAALLAEPRDESSIRSANESYIAALRHLMKSG